MRRSLLLSNEPNRRRASHRVLTATLVLAASSVGAGAGLWACGGDEAKVPGAGDGSVDGGDGTETGVPDPNADGGPGGDAAPPPPTPTEACIEYFKASCQRRQECGFGNSAACEALSAYCPDYFLGPGSTRTVDSVMACAAVRRTQACDELTRGIDPPCAAPGTRQGGEPCYFVSQCASMRCSNVGTCGTCASIKAPGTGCPATIDETCGQNKECVDPAIGCVPIPLPTRLPVGSPCQVDGGVDAATCPGDAPCAANAANAQAGTCSVPPTSGPCLFRLTAPSASICGTGTACLRVDPGLPGGECVPPGGKDALCGASYNGRACADGFFCTDPNNKGTCQPLHKVNETCSTTAQCEPALFCERQTAALGTCLPRAALGAECGLKTTDAGATYQVLCAPGLACDTSVVDASLVYTCVSTGVLGAACGAPNQGCAQALECLNGVCSLAACPADAGPG